MAFELREGQGSLFENRNKKEDRHPDYKGSIVIHGKTYRVAAWTKQTQVGKTFYSLQVDKMDLVGTTSNQQDGTDIPF